jgi:formylglycine-generating enzyme required for sulfatase activity
VRLGLGFSLALVALTWSQPAEGDPPSPGGDKVRSEKREPALAAKDEAAVRMVRIPGGKYRMGPHPASSEAIPGTTGFNSAVITVADFEIDVTEVTVAAYATCVEAGKCTEPQAREAYHLCNSKRADRKDHPVNCVDAEQAEAYCSFMGKRLPTEGEWERAARGGDDRQYPWGNAAPKDQPCWKRYEKSLGTCPVGSHPKDKSPYGVLDLAGNVDEWTSSTYCIDPNRKCRGPNLVSRGGAWTMDEPRYLEVRSRGASARNERHQAMGFRCARSLAP